MKTSAPSFRVKTFLRSTLVVWVATLALAFMPASLRADVPHYSPNVLSGMYKVVASNDPIFPLATERDWFLDFGEGAAQGRTSGNVAISLRQNPHVKVQIMVWQIYPEQNTLLIGNRTEDGSRQAVARGAWRVANSTSGVLFERDGYQMVLHRADAADY